MSDKGLETFATVEFDTDGYPYCEFTVDPVDLLKSDEIQKGQELVTKESALLAVEAEREANARLCDAAYVDLERLKERHIQNHPEPFMPVTYGWSKEMVHMALRMHELAESIRSRK